MTLGRIAAILTFVVVAGGIGAGFAAIGPPSRARTVALDERRVDDLIDIAGRVRNRGALPAAFSASEHGNPHDPVTGAPYTYVKESATRYRLCATFAAAAEVDASPAQWRHPAGSACFRFGKGAVAPIGGAFPPPPPKER
jgi:hypothetical protein